MAKKKYVSVKVDQKDTSLAIVKKDGIIRAATKAITNLINTKSGGKLSTTEKSAQGYLLTATVTSLKADNKDKPTKLDCKVSLLIMAVGSSARAFSGSSEGSVSNLSNPQADAEALVVDIFEDLMKQAIPKM